MTTLKTVRARRYTASFIGLGSPHVQVWEVLSKRERQIEVREVGVSGPLWVYKDFGFESRAEALANLVEEMAQHVEIAKHRLDMARSCLAAAKRAYKAETKA